MSADTQVTLPRLKLPVHRCTFSTSTPGHTRIITTIGHSPLPPFLIFTQAPNNVLLCPNLILLPVTSPGLTASVPTDNDHTAISFQCSHHSCAVCNINTATIRPSAGILGGVRRCLDDDGDDLKMTRPLCVKVPNVQYKHNHLFLREISYMYRLKYFFFPLCVHNQPDYGHTKGKNSHL
jgi:hypothetical protein